MLIITTGRQAVDIDGVACIYALTYAYNLLGISTWPIVEGELAATVTDDIKTRLPRFADSLPVNFKDYQVGLVDVSDPKSLPGFAEIYRINFLIDHHVGYQEYWEHAIGSRARIEFIGSCASQVWEEIKRLGVSDKLDQLSYELLALGIISNTLNFNATITNHRDKAAYSQIEKLTDKDISAQDYIEKYYKHQQKIVTNDIALAAINDTKSINSICISQIEVWEDLRLSHDNVSEITRLMRKQYPENTSYLINMVSIENGYNRIYGDTKELESINEQLRGEILIDHRNNTPHIKTKLLMLRKELYRLLLKS
jgi:nanoRNase/pAp phosphatase (c-di-AMP/oligoRNAs hydrolase)